MARRKSQDPVVVASSGRHDDSAGGGLSVAELIARSKAPPLTPPLTAVLPASSSAPANPASANPAPPARRHLSAVVDGAVAVIPDVLAADSPTLLVDAAALPAVKTSKAGRNLPAAIGVGLGLGGLILLTLFLYRPSFVVVVGLAAAMGVFEMVTAIGTVEARPPLVPLLVGGAAMDAVGWFRGADGLVGALLLTVLGLIVWRLGDGAAGYLPDVASAVLVATYVPFLAGFAALLAHPDDGAARIVIFILAVVCSDTGGYAAGVLIGRHPMAPMVSPKKSWEGFGGSLLASSVCGVLMMTLCFHHEWWKGVLFGAAIAVTATLGDLGESMIKRDLGLKDMGKLLPGHGGIMDRLDSLLPCAAVAYLLLAAFLR